MRPAHLQGQYIHCFAVFSYARPDEKAILVIALWSNMPTPSYPHQMWVGMCTQLSALQNSGQLFILFVCFTFSSRCWLGIFWTGTLVKLLQDRFQQVLVSPLCYEKLLLIINNLKNFNEFSIIQQDYYFPGLPLCDVTNRKFLNYDEIIWIAIIENKFINYYFLKLH